MLASTQDQKKKYAVGESTSTANFHRFPGKDVRFRCFSTLGWIVPHTPKTYDDTVMFAVLC